MHAMRCKVPCSTVSPTTEEKQGDTTPSPPSAEDDGLFNLSGPSQDGKVTRGARARHTRAQSTDRDGLRSETASSTDGMGRDSQVP